MTTQDGPQYTFGSDKCCVYFVDLMEDMPTNHKNYIYSTVNEFYEVSSEIYKKYKLKNRTYIAKVVMAEYVKKAEKYLTGIPFTVFQNVLITRLRKLNKKYPLNA